MMTTAVTGRLPVTAADTMQPQVRCAHPAAAAEVGCDSRHCIAQVPQNEPAFTGRLPTVAANCT